MSGETLHPGLRMAAFLLCPHVAFLRAPGDREAAGDSSPSDKATAPSDQTPCYGLVHRSHLLKTLSLIRSHGVGLPHVNLGDHDSVHAEASGGSGVGGVTPDGALARSPRGSCLEPPPSLLGHQPVWPARFARREAGGQRAVRWPSHAPMAAQPTSVLKVKFGDNNVETAKPPGKQTCGGNTSFRRKPCPSRQGLAAAFHSP